MAFNTVLIPLALIGAALAVQILSISLVLWRSRGRKPLAATEHPALSVLRPVRGLEAGLEETLRSSFTARSATYEVIFCVADAADPAVPVIRSVIAAHPGVPARLLIGDDRISGNPKLNNLTKGWAAARHDWIVMIDSNVLLPGDYIETLFETWTEGTGLVSSPPAGQRAEGFWASVEAGFLNSYQARWQLASDQIGNGFAQGKVLMWQRALLERAGGMMALAGDLAEDVASTKLVRAAGLKVRLLRAPFPQPLHHRAAAEVWSRQRRWALLRRSGFPALFALEPLSFAALPALLMAPLVVTGMLPPVAMLGYFALWYGMEWLLARRLGWPSSLDQLGPWVMRDLLLPAVWVSALAAKGFVWRGNERASTPTAPAEQEARS